VQGKPAIALHATEQVDTSMSTGFTCVLVRAEGAWTVVQLSPFAAQ
jgi:hypothetical protein